MKLKINRFAIFSFTILTLVLLYSGCKNQINPEDIILQIPAEASDYKIDSFPPSNYGYLIYDISENRVVKAHNSKKSFIPASITKLFTAIYALENFKKEANFETEILYTGKIKDNQLNGNLYLKGSGDPSLTISELIELVKQLKAKGIKQIEGSFFYDESLFPSKNMIDESMSPEARYNTGLSALNLNNNLVYSVQLKNNEGRVTGYSIMPPNNLHSTRRYSGFPTYRPIKFSSNSNREIWAFPEKGIIPRQQLPVKNPALFTAWTFKQICKIHGITIPDPKAGIAPSKTKKIALSKSTNISTIIRDMLHSSNNTTAELIATTSIIKATGEYKNSMEPIEDFYKKRFTQIDWADFHLENGSGLTSTGRVTPEQAAAILIYADKKMLHEKEADFYLPLSGFEGTMTARMDSPDAAMRVYAKTGNIFFASALTGFFYANSGKKYIFSIFISDIEKRKSLDSKNGGTQSQIQEAVLWTSSSTNAIDRFIIENIKKL
ncbi:MAG: D-alanyl-D-alanine carboxypeptidase/D-alanyl-D-alanine-endopeptidase [Spirochaetota bacterium]